MMDKSPLTPEQTAFLQGEVVREAQRTLVGRRFLGIYGPLGAGLESIVVEHYSPDGDAEINFFNRPDPEPIEAEREVYLRVPIIYKDFVLHWRDIEFSKKTGAPLDASRAIRAAHFVSHREDELLFNGENRLNLDGLLNAPGRNVQQRSEWKEYGKAYRDVRKATEVLLSQNHHRPFALVVSAKDYARLVEQKEGQFAPELGAISGLCDDGVYTSPVIPEGKSVVISAGDQNFDIAVTEDLKMTFLCERDQDMMFRVYECLVLRIKRPSAICTIE